LGTSLAAETSFQQFFWNQRFKPGFLESLDTARRSACATKSRSRWHQEVWDWPIPEWRYRR